MSESFSTTPPSQQQWSGSKTGNGYQGSFESKDVDDSENEAGKALLIGLLGGLLSAAGYMIYRRLPEEQKDKLNAQVRTVVAQRISELRQNFNV